MNDELIERLEEGVLVLTLNRPERLNALTREMTTLLLSALRRAALDPAVRSVAIAGAGRGFCAGGDVKDMADEAPAQNQTLEERAQLVREAAECSRLLHEMPKPTVALLRGAVAGAGLSLALACDLRIASDTLKLTSAFVKVGLSGDFGGSWFLSKLLGPRAREFVMLSPVLDAQAALAMGLVGRVVADADLDAQGLALAKSLASGPTITMGHIKANLALAERGASLAEVLDQESLRHVRCGMTEDHQEAARAFVAKRAPMFLCR